MLICLNHHVVHAKIKVLYIQHVRYVKMVKWILIDLVWSAKIQNLQLILAAHSVVT